MTDKLLNVFLLEDLPTDVMLIKRAVKKLAPKGVFTVAENRASFMEKIDWGGYDVILADYNLPDFNGLEALLIVKEKMPHVPFVFVTGTLNSEEKAADAILQGASGYLLKDNLTALPEKLEEILLTSKAKFSEIEQLEKQKRRNEMLLQKIAGLIKKSADFEHKNEVEKALNEILEPVLIPNDE